MSNSIILPKVFSIKDIEYLTGGKGNPEWEKYIGQNKISYSDINIFLDDTYSTNPLKDFVLQRFFGQESEIHPEYANFGKCVEYYITTKNEKCGLSKEEMQVLDNIKPLGTFQTGFLIDFNNFVLVGLTDDLCLECDQKTIRDYKTASKSSYEKKYKDSETNMQLQIYALDWMVNRGIIPDKLELTIIERLGNPYRPSEKLKVGQNIWTKEFTTNEKELLKLELKIIDTVKEISDFYKVFLKLNI